MPKVSEDHRDQRRAQILGAAKRCFTRNGFHRTTISDICEESGLSTGAIYSYFDGKEALVKAVAEQTRSKIGAYLAERGYSQDSHGEKPIETLVGWLDSIIRSLNTSDDAVRTASMDIRLRAEALDTVELHTLVQEAFRDWKSWLGEVVVKAQRDGHIDEDLDPAAVGEVLLFLVVGLQVGAALDRNLELESIRRVCHWLLLDGRDGK